MKPAMYKPKDVATIFGVTPETIRNKCIENEIPHKKIGNQYRIPIAWVEQELKSLDNELPT